jgi:hypothetical protein
MATKKTSLELLSERSKNAIDLVLTTIESLKVTNKSIDEEYQKNNIMIESIQETNHSLGELKLNNEKIIGNFEKLLK